MVQINTPLFISRLVLQKVTIKISIKILFANFFISTWLLAIKPMCFAWVAVKPFQRHRNTNVSQQRIGLGRPFLSLGRLQGSPDSKGRPRPILCLQ